MNKLPMLPADTYTVINKTILHNSDRKLLITLYQPIIGSLAINLYFTLWSYLDNDEIMSLDWTHHHLLSSMQVNMESIIESREKLEAIGLIKTYLKENKINSYVYELYSPLNANDFLNDPILSTVLYNNVGEKEYKKIVESFKMPSCELTGYKNISSSFNDVFVVSDIININHLDEIKKENRLGVSYNQSIDLNNILSMIPEEMINLRSITPSIKEVIYKIALVYNYNDSNLVDIIQNSLDEKHSIDIEQLKSNARKYYKFENGNKLPSLIYKNQPEYLRSKVTGTSKKAKKIYEFETTSPYEYLTNINGCNPSKTETDILIYLLMDVDLKPGVVNVLIDYILKTSDNKLIKSFVENKAVEWKRNNIETVEDAMNQAAKEYKSKKPKEIRKEVEKPSWFNQTIEKEEATEEEQKAFLERLKNME